MKFPADGKKMKKALKHKWPVKGQGKKPVEPDADDMPAKKAKKILKKKTLHKKIVAKAKKS